MPPQNIHEEQSVQRAGEDCAACTCVGHFLLMLCPSAAQMEIQEDRSDRDGPSKVESRM